MAAGWRSVRVRWSRRVGARLAVLAALSALAANLSTSPAAADPTDPQGDTQVWAGADISSNVWLVYSGVTVAPWSRIYDEGFLFRAAGGYGGYTYSYTHAQPEPDGGETLTPRSADARTYYGEVLVGYLKRFGELTAKAFIGASIVSHDIELPEQTIAIGIGEEVGIKGALELWLNIGERGWGSLDLSWSTAHDTRAVRARLGYRVWPKLSIGVEGGLHVDAQGECRVKGTSGGDCGHVILSDDGGVTREPSRAELLDYARGGGFVRYEWGVSELSVSAGVLRDTFGDKDDVAPYVTVNWLTQF